MAFAGKLRGTVASSLLALLDDITTILDDVAVLTKLSAKKTAGVLGDDLALNAEQVTGVDPSRELPVVWAVAKGSAWNKVILVPAALAVSAIASWLVTVLLMLGGAFLCFEGFEKVAHKLFHPPASDDAARSAHAAAVANPAVDLVAMERDKIRGAVRTDFILSGEIVVIALGTVADKPFVTQLGVLVAMSALMTVGVYGLVAAIVKLDDAGLALTKRGGGGAKLGRALLWGAPYLMKALSVAGTAAMFLVGGGIVVHGVPPVEALFTTWTAAAAGVPGVGGLLGFVTGVALPGLAGMVAGAVLVGLLSVAKRLRGSAPEAGGAAH